MGGPRGCVIDLAALVMYMSWSIGPRVQDVVAERLAERFEIDNGLTFQVATYSIKIIAE